MPENVSFHEFPPVLDLSKVGTYSALAKAGGGYVWDEVLEYSQYTSEHFQKLLPSMASMSCTSAHEQPLRTMMLPILARGGNCLCVS